MTVLVTGANGFIGNTIIRKLVAQHTPVRAMVRDAEKTKKRLGSLDGVEIVNGDVRDLDSVKKAVDGVEAVIHLAAIPMEKGDATYESVNFNGTVNVVDAAKAAGVKRFINMSQNGASSQVPYRFLKSKGMAQEYVAQHAPAWTALRPSAVFGPQDEFFNTFARLLKVTPLVFPLVGGGKAEFQPVSVYDVAEAAVRSLTDETAIGKEFTLGGPEVLTLGDIERRVIEAVGSWRLLVPAPVALLRPAVWVMERVLPGSPVTTGLLDLLAVPNTTPNNALVTHFGMQPIPFSGEHIAYLRDNTLGDTLAKFFRNATVN